MANPPSSLDVTKTVAEIIAYLSAAAFFIYKAIAGYLIVNVSVSGTIDRVRANDTEDHLTVAATVKKGSNGSVELHDARARASYGDNKTKDMPFVGIERLSFKSADHRGGRKLVAFGTSSERNPLLRLAPEEEATFSGIVRVPISEACVVEVVFIGKRTGSWKVGQWRTSLVSLPHADHSNGTAV